jgi:hypothetical protein
MTIEEAMAAGHFIVTDEGKAAEADEHASLRNWRSELTLVDAFSVGYLDMTDAGREWNAAEIKRLHRELGILRAQE